MDWGFNRKSKTLSPVGCAVRTDPLNGEHGAPYIGAGSSPELASKFQYQSAARYAEIDSISVSVKALAKGIMVLLCGPTSLPAR